MQITQFILITPYLTFVSCEMETYIIDGQDADITQFPHSAFLFIKCSFEDGTAAFYVCGSSIVNQYLTLTAAHCTETCTAKTLITTYVGHAVRFFGISTTAHSFFQHEEYDSYTISNDICLVRLTSPLKFSATVNRVALMENPPYDEEAVVAGWGRFNELDEQTAETLQYATQFVKRGKDCPPRLTREDPGFICTFPKEGRAAQGDSGSALVVRNYIQIGIVSHAFLLTDAVFFTDTGYYYKWIKKGSKIIMCAYDGSVVKNASICKLARDGNAC